MGRIADPLRRILFKIPDVDRQLVEVVSGYIDNIETMAVVGAGAAQSPTLPSPGPMPRNPRYFRLAGETNNAYMWQNAGMFWYSDNGSTLVTQIDNAGYIFNEQGSDIDFKIEGDTDTQLFLVDAGSDVIAMGGAVDASYKLKIHGELYKTSYTDIGEISDPGASASNVVRLFAHEKHLISLNEDDVWHDISASAHGKSSFIHTEVTISDQGGLNIQWGAGSIFDALITGGAQIVTIAAQTNNQAMTASSMNYFYFDKSAGNIAYTIDPDADIDWAGGDFTIGLVSTTHNDIIDIDQFPVGNQELHYIREIIDEAFHTIIHRGLIVSQHTDGLTWDIDQTTGAYTHGGIDHHNVSARSAPTMRRWFHNASNTWESDTNAQIDADNWDDDDDSAGVTTNADAKWYRSTFYTDANTTHWVYPQVEYDNLNAALVAADPTPPHILEHMPKTITVVMRGNDASFPVASSEQWIDVRSMLGTTGGGGAVSDHGSLSGLSDDDHTIYFLLAGETSTAVVSSVNGIDYTPGSDTDTDLITVNVTDTPILKWDESESAFDINMNFQIPATTSTVGQIKQDGIVFFHTFAPVDRVNFFMGALAGNFTLTGYSNFGIGSRTLDALTDGNWNTAFGEGTLGACTGGWGNVGVGGDALMTLTTGNSNIGVGGSSLRTTTGDQNTAIGVDAGRNITSGSRNIGIGQQGCRNAGSGSDNIGIGVWSLLNANTTAGIIDNIAIGTAALNILTTGSGNVAIGRDAGILTTTGSNNILIGKGVDSSAAGASNEVSIGGLYMGYLAAHGSGPAVNFMGGTPQSQQAHIIDADGTIGDITTKFNTLLADLEGYGLLAT